MARKEDVQVRIVKPGKHLLPEGYLRLGRMFWTDRESATRYVNDGLVEIVTGPAETQTVGPGETKPAGAAEKKSSDGDLGTRSTASQSSSAPGTVGLSSASAAGRASPKGKSSTLRLGAQPDSPKDGSDAS